MPAGLPAIVQRESHIIRVQAPGGIGTPALPPIVDLQQSGSRSISDTNYSLGGVLNAGLDERPVSVHLPINSQSSKAIESIAGGIPASVPGSTSQYKSVLIVLDDLELTPSARQGGFF